MAKNFVSKYQELLKTEDHQINNSEIKNNGITNEKMEKKAKKLEDKLKKKNEQKTNSKTHKTNRILSSCRFCFSNKFISNELILHTGENLAIILPSKSLISFYFFN